MRLTLACLTRGLLVVLNFYFFLSYKDLKHLIMIKTEIKFIAGDHSITIVPHFGHFQSLAWAKSFADEAGVTFSYRLIF